LKAISCRSSSRSRPDVRIEAQQPGHRVDVHGVGLVAGQAQQHGLVAAVSLAGGTRASRTGCTARVRSCDRAWPSFCRRCTKSLAARIGPTVCELLGPMPILKRSKTEIAMGRQLA
jgi:hypothetical protein